MDFARHGWTPEEIQHMQAIASRHSDNSVNEQFSLWVMVLVLAAGSMFIGMLLLPVMLFTPLSIPISLLLGLCMGFLLTHALATLNIERKHHMIAAAVLAVISFGLLLCAVQTLLRQFAPIHQPDMILVCAIYTVSMFIPYFRERRLHEPA
jgi:hypothetical protein